MNTIEFEKHAAQAKALEDAVRAIASQSMDEARVKQLISENAGVDQSQVRSIFDEALAAAIGAIPPKEIIIKRGAEVETVKGEFMHDQFQNALTILTSGLYPMFIGPAASGKSFLARQLAKYMKLEFFTQGPVDSKYGYLGFNDAQGRYVTTQTKECFENGGLLCIEEGDASEPTALVGAVNQIAANPEADFGNLTITKHSNFHFIFTANTWGKGADRSYVGRYQLDASTVSRFVQLYIGYDEIMERAVAAHDKWTDFVLSVRHAIEKLELQHLVTPRATYFGAALLRNGMDRKQCAELLVWRDLDKTTVTKIKTQIKESTT